MTKLEEVADAIWDALAYIEDKTKDDYFKAARDAVVAMREPNRAMLNPEAERGNQHTMMDVEAAATWKRMIDTILNDSETP